MSFIEDVKNNLLAKRLKVSVEYVTKLKKLFLGDNIDKYVFEKYEPQQITVYRFNKNKDITNNQSVQLLEDDNYIGKMTKGGRSKRYFRASTKDLLRDLAIEKINNPACAYKTGVDGLFELSKDINDISVIRFGGSWLDTTCGKEVVSSRILNELGIPTEYNMRVLQVDGNSVVPRLISVNFLSKDERFISLSEIQSRDNAQPTYDIKNQVDYMLNAIKYYKAITGSELDFDMSMVEKQIVESYMVRKFLLCDTDYNISNIGIVVNDKTHQLSIAPNFDLEGCINNKINIDELKQTISIYPEIFHNCLSKFEKLIDGAENNTSKLDQILESCGVVDTDSMEKGKKEISICPVGIEESEYKDILISNISCIKEVGKLYYSRENTEKSL